jgi:hypothetical protein
MTPDIPYNARVTPEQQNCANHGSAMHVHGVRGRAPSSISARFIQSGYEDRAMTSLPETVTDQLPGLEKIGGGE